MAVLVKGTQMSVRQKTTMKKWLVGLVVILVACASEAPPPGGPEDTTPPNIVMTDPAPGATGVSPTTDVVIEFSEYLNQRSVAPSVFISPYIPFDYSVDVRRRTVTINFAEPLEDSTTYIITLRTAIADLRGNTLPQSYQLAFSTGEQIDRGTIAGRVFREDAPDGAITVLAYSDGDYTIDSLLSRRPDYISNPGPEGLFRFDNMLLGDYFFLAIQDQNSNYLYDRGEWLGIPSDTLWTVADTLAESHLRMKMFQFPADSLVLTTVDQQNRHQLTAGFNRTVRDQVDESHFLYINADGDTVQPAAVSRAGSRSEFLIEQYQLIPDSSYLFLARDIYGEYSLPLGNRQDRRDITLSTGEDTLALLPPSISINDSTTGVVQSQDFVIRFERAVQPIEPSSLLHVENIDTNLYSLSWLDDRTIAASPDSLWPAEQWLDWTLIDSLVYDLRDSTYSDSISSGSFQFESGARYGSITGEVAVPEGWSWQLLRVQASLIEGEEVYQAWVNRQYQYNLTRLPSGTYRVQAYLDSDSSETFTMGRPLPFVPAEKFIIFADSIEVRSRWETSAVNFKFTDD